MTGPELFAATKLAPEQAVAYLKGKGLLVSDAWHEVWQEANAKGFTVARALRTDVLQDLHEEVLKIVTEGATEAEFVKALTPRLKARGWWGKEERVDLETGEVTEVRLGSPHRLKTIYRTNAQTAYQAGRYRAFDENRAARPYWQYVAVLDSRTRPAHAALDGKVFALDDPATELFWPPNDWGCRCRARALSQDDLERRGLVPEETAGKIGWEDVPLGKDGPVKPRATYRTTDALGEPVTFKAGAGWSYNPGQAWQKPFTPAPRGAPLPTLAAAAAPPVPLERLGKKPFPKAAMLPPHQESGWSDETYVARFLAEFGASIGRPAVFTDKAGEPVVISEELFRDRPGQTLKVRRADREQYLPLLADTIKDPAEIRLVWLQGEAGPRLCRRYIGLYAAESGRGLGGFAVFDWIGGQWQGTTTFKPRSLAYLEQQRTGVLLYARE